MIQGILLSDSTENLQRSSLSLLAAADFTSIGDPARDSALNLRPLLNQSDIPL
jgi:hypothetical protein